MRGNVVILNCKAFNKQCGGLIVKSLEIPHYAYLSRLPKEYANAWMVQSLNPKGIIINKGNIVCSKELNKPEHWRE